MKILLIDDHVLFREGLIHILKGLDVPLEVVEASNYEQAGALSRLHSDLDLVLLDINLPGRDGFDVLDEFTIRYPALPVVIISSSKQAADLKRAIESGAMGYIPKDMSSDMMLNALKLVLNGDIYIPHEVYLADNAAACELTMRQLDVLKLIVLGHSNKSIANLLSITEGTVKAHVSAVFKVLDVDNRTQAVLAAQTMGLVR